MVPRLFLSTPHMTFLNWLWYTVIGGEGSNSMLEMLFMHLALAMLLSTVLMLSSLLMHSVRIRISSWSPEYLNLLEQGIL